ncbi:YusW family protein [Halobacillus sp. ACCC02827]|uniref:YusW family protein n=1 Tax=Halobacillus sp. ACCC02827 TaxID=3052090 RepID=UPI002570ACB9|nr:YusW family protein [Halobacillus sp. ACCC02827]WJE14215.1 YusW family protein [Halobacillus sp. ACCC02827]
MKVVFICLLTGFLLLSGWMSSPETAKKEDRVLKQSLSSSPQHVEQIHIGVIYPNNKVVRIRFHSGNQQSAAYRDDRNLINWKGEEAWRELDGVLESLILSKELDESFYKNAVLEMFAISTDYKEFSMEVTFEDGTKLKMEE